MRVMKRVLLTLAMAIGAPAHGQIIAGGASAVDGDTLAITNIRIRLHGIDAPEARQTCKKGEEEWACGQDAKMALASLVNEFEVLCVQNAMDAFGRSVATCHIGGMDLGLAMIEAGLAVALENAPPDYLNVQARRREAKIGIWSSQFVLPAEFRAANPQSEAQGRPSDSPKSVWRAPTRSGVMFRNCKEAWAAGAAPLYRDQPGYRPEMDSDGDGIACEPFNRQH
jgi:endonuclease YncB( thermonuclease family)